MDPLNVKKDFLEALRHHPSFLSEFLIYKQQKSGWSKAAYLKAMESELSRQKLLLHLLKDEAKAKNPDIDESLIGKTLDEITEGKVKEYFTLRTHKNTLLLNADALETFGFYLKRAFTFGEPEPAFSNLQIISFAIKAFDFILDEFKIQTGIKKTGTFFRIPPKGFKPTTTDGKPVHLIYNYIIAVPTPVFDYYLFEERFRDLLLNSNHPERLGKMVAPLFRMSEEIINLWNEKLSLLEDITDETVVKTNRAISFNTDKRNFTIYSDLHPFIWNDNKRLNNYQLTVYAANIGHLVAEELSEKSKSSSDRLPEVKDDPIKSKMLLLYLYKRNGQLNKVKYKKIVTEALNITDRTFENHFRELRYYIDGDLRLKDGERETWEQYNFDLDNSSIIDRLKQLKLD